jgi:hypothetical protein
MKRDSRTGLRLVLAATLAAASMIGVRWCDATLVMSPAVQMAVKSLMLPPFLVLIFTCAREVGGMNQRSAS